MDPEVLQHVEDGLEPEVLNPALPILIQGEAEVLGRGEGLVREARGMLCCLPLQQGPRRPPGVPPLTLAFPWKLKVRTYSPRLVSLCRTKKTP